MSTTTLTPASKLNRKSFEALLGERKPLVAGLVAASIVSALAETGILAITAMVATELVNNAHKHEYSLGPLTLHTSLGGLLTLALVLAVIRLLVQSVTSYFPALISSNVQATFRRRLLASYINATWEVQSQDREGHFQEMMGQQITLASFGAVNATNLIVVSANLVIMTASSFALNPLASVAAFAAAAVLFAMLRPLNKASSRAARTQSATQMGLAGAVGEANRLSEEAQVLGVREAQQIYVDGFIDRARLALLRTQAIGRLGPNLYQSAIYIGVVLGLILLRDTKATGLASLGAVVLLLVRAGGYGTLAQNSYQTVLQALPYVDRLQDAVSRFSGNPTRHGNRVLQAVGELRFDDVEFSYRPEQPILRGVSFTVQGGETVGVIGPTGAGKSTIVQLLLRLRNPRAGAYLVNGEDSDDYTEESWSSRVSYLPQQPKLLHASVRDNVRFYRDISDGDVELACRQAHIHDEIVSWPKGYDTVVGPRADAVSGGQQQRLCLARAIAARPSVLVLDEPTSALDPHSEGLIQESLIELRKTTTLFVIAHRMSTLTICDRVMVVLDGRLDAFASLEELSANNDYYRHAASVGTVAEVNDEL